MKPYIRTSKVSAIQFSPSEEEKASLEKDPKKGKVKDTATFLGGDIRKVGNEFFVTGQAGDQKVVLAEGDWLVKEGDRYTVVTNEEFENSFEPAEEDEETEENEVEKVPFDDEFWAQPNNTLCI